MYVCHCTKEDHKLTGAVRNETQDVVLHVVAVVLFGQHKRLREHASVHDTGGHQQDRVDVAEELVVDGFAVDFDFRGWRTNRFEVLLNGLRTRKKKTKKRKFYKYLYKA